MILHERDCERWLERGDPKQLSVDPLRPFPVEEMKAWKVGSGVGNVRNNNPSLVEPLERSNKYDDSAQSEETNARTSSERDRRTTGTIVAVGREFLSEAAKEACDKGDSLGVIQPCHIRNGRVFLAPIHALDT